MDPQSLSRRDLRRLVGGLWSDPRCEPVASRTVAAALESDATSLDRTLLTAYLRHFPREHPAFEQLRAAAQTAANRHDWPWRERGKKWKLWNPRTGPGTLAKALTTHEDGAAILRQAGLDGDLAQAGFAEAALEQVCVKAGEAKEGKARELGERLISLVDQLGLAAPRARLVWGLLAPWLDHPPVDDYQERLTAFLVARFGHPRLKPDSWRAMQEEMAHEDAGRLSELLSQWLTQRAVRQFFRIVSATTDNPEQWNAREEFWTAYLEDKAIDGAWFAFGKQAELLARGAVEQGEFGQITGSGADPSHSALIMAIGDIRIAEWSHNGSARFWIAQDRQAPELFKREYYAITLRAMNGGRGFEQQFAALPHLSGWQSRFAHHIFKHSGRRHTRWGEGHAPRSWN
ncbi:MAG: EH signature domain-containing protein [Novosphingobium sp.]